MKKSDLQRGATLLVALIMLLVMTLFAVATYNITRVDMEIVGNLQARGEALNAAQQAIETAISSTRFFEQPDNVFQVPCQGNNTRCYDVNGDGSNDIVVALNPAPACVEARVLKNSELDLGDAADAACAVGAQQSFGVAGASSGDSLCATTLWEVNAVANDAVTLATASVAQGMSIRVSTDNVAASCP